MCSEVKLSKLAIGNQIYQINPVPNLSILEDDNLRAFGIMKWREGIIEYDSKVSPALIEETLMHEILEVIKHTISDIEWPEWQMDIIARHLIQVLHQFGFSLVKEVSTETNTENSNDNSQ